MDRAPYPKTIICLFILILSFIFSSNSFAQKTTKEDTHQSKKKNRIKKNIETQSAFVLPFSYDPSSWMKDLLLSNGKGDYTLKDIVIPGSHDAGMSVLTAAGGQQKGTINECNTLTQKINIGQQLQSGLRMFDLRIGMYEGEMYAKHCASDCMEDAIGGGYGERFRDVLTALREFMIAHDGEIVILTFSHFCDKEIGAASLADSIVDYLGEEIVFKRKGKQEISQIPLSEMAGKVLLSFEGFSGKEGLVENGIIADKSDAFINFRRRYAATNELNKLLLREQLFWEELKNNVHKNDIVRLDWQLTQSADEAAMACNAFESEHAGIMLNATILLINQIRKHKSIIKLAKVGNDILVQQVNKWINDKTINAINKPNILYVDAADHWITDYCVYLNSGALYTK